MIRVSKCCCCISIKQGCYLIGAIHLVSLVLGLISVNPLQIALDVFTGCTFLHMVLRDSEQARLFYFSAYSVYALFLGSIRLVLVLWDADGKTIVKEYCDELEELVVLDDANTQGWASTDYSSMQDCLHQVGSQVRRDEFIGLALVLGLQAHFMLVLYQHYKNADLQRSKGGCLPDKQERSLQMRQVDSGIVNVSRTVEHAVEDEDLQHSTNMS